MEPPEVGAFMLHWLVQIKTSTLEDVYTHHMEQLQAKRPMI
jgi:hypothetical protein